MTQTILEAQAAHKANEDKLAELRAQLKKISDRAAEIEARRDTLAEERKQANLRGEAFTQALALREATDEADGISDAKAEVERQIKLAYADSEKSAKELGKLDATAKLEALIERILTHVSTANKSFKLGTDALGSIHSLHVEADKIARASFGATESFAYFRAGNRLGDLIAGLLSAKLAGGSAGNYGSVQFNPQARADANFDWVAQERDELQRELQGVLAIERMRALQVRDAQGE